jgi:hypothetical protein
VGCYQWEGGRGGENVWEGKYNANYIHMYVNGKITHIETILSMGEERIKENGGGMNLAMIYLIYCKNFSNYHNVTPAQQ